MSGIETNIIPGEVLDGARKLTDTTNQLMAAWKSASASIEGLNAGAPWGNDSYGQEFNKGYLAGDGSAKALLEGGTSIVETLNEFGPAVTAGTNAIVEVDEANAAHIASIYKP
jgi:hypothetical protein